MNERMMAKIEQRAEPRIMVTCRGTLTLDERSAPCVIQNMCSRGFLIKFAHDLPVGRNVRLRCELDPDRVVECTVEIRHVNAGSLGAKVIEISEDGRLLCSKFLEERRGARL